MVKIYTEQESQRKRGNEGQFKYWLVWTGRVWCDDHFSRESELEFCHVRTWADAS